MAKKKNLAMYGISRIDDEVYYTHAWRVSLRRRGKALVKNFPDKTYGGKRKALQAAKEHRDKLVAKYPPLTRKEHATALRKNNKSGISGVCRFASSYFLKDGTERFSWYWEAIWPTTPGEHESVRFSVNRYGEEGAFKKACAARRKGLKKVEGVFWASKPGE